MSLKSVSGTLSFVALVIVISPYTMADDLSELGWYGGANVGESRAKIDDQRIIDGLAASGYSTTSMHNESNSTGFKIFGGYQFNRYFALEGGYFDLGQFGFAARTVPAGVLNGNARFNGLNIDAVGILPVTQRFSLFGRAGVDYAQAQDTFGGTGAITALNPTPHTWGTHYDFGAGLQYAVTKSVDVRAEAERYRLNDAVGNMGDIDVFSLGVIYRFGHKAEPVPVPCPVVETPAPQTQVVVVAPPPPPERFEKYTLSSMDLFSFDSAQLRMPQSKLDEIATVLNKHSEVDHVMITGYTDRIGSDKYNMGLSQRRAVAVKDYLISKGVDANRLTTQGKGKADPVVVCTDKKRPALISCLAPNRRVEVEQISIERRVP